MRRVPIELTARNQWCLWKTILRGGEPTKAPFQTNGQSAKSNDPATWCDFGTALKHVEGYDGIGFVFTADDPFVGIDLDGCRDPETGVVADWAKTIIEHLDTYAEVSPSETGVKLFAVGKLESDWHKVELPDQPRVCEKMPAIEVYDRGRYFAVTGVRLRGPLEPMDRQEQIDAIVERMAPKRDEPTFTGPRQSPVIDRARKYLTRLPAAVSGQRGHDATFRAACVLVKGFALDRSEALALLSEWNQACQPPWSAREIEHKIDSATKAPGEVGYLRDVPMAKWNSVRLPTYHAPAPQPEVRPLTTLDSAARKYLDVLVSGQGMLLETGIPDLDYTLGGGLARSEMVILAARPSHGKSAVALQMLHHWTAQGRPSLLISEEMSQLAIGQRVLQFVSEVPAEHWRHMNEAVSSELECYQQSRAKCYVAEGCRTAELAALQIENAAKEFGVQCVTVDYAGLLRGEGKSRYEQTTNTSICLKQAALANNVTLIVQCQMNREVEKRPKFLPQSSDLRDTGQLEQDADVIIFCCWPHRLDPKNDPKEFQFFVTKNRNRGINGNGRIHCEFQPSRQMFIDQKPANYVNDFAHWNDRDTDDF